MRKRLITGTLLSVLALQSCPIWADTIQMLPPTPIGTTVVCPSGTQQLLSYSGAPSGTVQSGINCVPVTADAQGDLTVSGYIQIGQSNMACDTGHAGAIRYNPVSLAFEGCTGSGWQYVGGGLTTVVGGCQTTWSACPSGYRATSYFSPGTYNCCDKCGNPAWRYTVCSQ